MQMVSVQFCGSITNYNTAPRRSGRASKKPYPYIKPLAQTKFALRLVRQFFRDQEEPTPAPKRRRTASMTGQSLSDMEDEEQMHNLRRSSRPRKPKSQDDEHFGEQLLPVSPPVTTTTSYATPTSAASPQSRYKLSSSSYDSYAKQTFCSIRKSDRRRAPPSRLVEDEEFGAKGEEDDLEDEDDGEDWGGARRNRKRVVEKEEEEVPRVNTRRSSRLSSLVTDEHTWRQ